MSSSKGFSKAARLDASGKSGRSLPRRKTQIDAPGHYRSRLQPAPTFSGRSSRTTPKSKKWGSTGRFLNAVLLLRRRKSLQPALGRTVPESVAVTLRSSPACYFETFLIQYETAKASFHLNRTIFAGTVSRSRPADSGILPLPEAAAGSDAVKKSGNSTVMTCDPVNYFIYKGSPMGYSYELARKPRGRPRK